MVNWMSLVWFDVGCKQEPVMEEAPLVVAVKCRRGDEVPKDTSGHRRGKKMLVQGQVSSWAQMRNFDVGKERKPKTTTQSVK